MNQSERMRSLKPYYRGKIPAESGDSLSLHEPERNGLARCSQQYSCIAIF